MQNQDINVLAMIKGEERYIFLYNDANRTEVLRTLGRFAADPQLSFNWHDAGMLSRKVRDLAYQQLVEELSHQLDDSPSSAMSCNSRLNFRHENDMI
jgi:hypothetical protein